jgi:glycosyltransferase involved in cell wall biosynthesis
MSRTWFSLVAGFERSGEPPPAGPPALPGVSVVIPCLNEEASIGQVIAAARAGLKALGTDGEVIVVDNGSTDRSIEVARQAGARLLVEAHRGYGSALRRGFAAARHEILLMGDGDLTYDFEKLGDLVRPILAGEAQFVIGNRMGHILPGAMPPLHRYVGNPLLSGLLRLMFHDRRVRDAHCGLRAISRDAYRRLRCVTTGMEFASEMVVRAIQSGVAIAQRDIVYHPRIGDSKLNSFRDGWRHLRFLILHSPTMMLLLPGAVCWVLGLALGLPVTFRPVGVGGGDGADLRLMVAAGLLHIVGMQILTTGLLAKSYAHLSGLRHDEFIARLYRWFTFERTFLGGALVALAGVALAAAVHFGWVPGGPGSLSRVRLLAFAVLLLVDGVQLGLASYLFSIMALPRHIDALTAENENTGIADL